MTHRAVGYAKLMLTAALALAGAAVAAQDGAAAAGRRRNELGVDVANIITFLSKKSESYLLNYKRRVGERHALRSALNLEWSTAKDGYKSVKARLGYEYDLPMVADQWLLYGGADASFLRRASNFQPNRATTCGLHPLVGVSYFLSKQFSVSTEMNLNLCYTRYRNPASFDPSDNADAFDVNIGSVGMLIVSYHF